MGRRFPRRHHHAGPPWTREARSDVHPPRALRRSEQKWPRRRTSDRPGSAPAAPDRKTRPRACRRTASLPSGACAASSSTPGAARGPRRRTRWKRPLFVRRGAQPRDARGVRARRGRPERGAEPAVQRDLATRFRTSWFIARGAEFAERPVLRGDSSGGTQLHGLAKHVFPGVSSSTSVSRNTGSSDPRHRRASVLENVWLAARGGIGSYRATCARCAKQVGRQRRRTSGVVPFIRGWMLTSPRQPGSLRRGSAAAICRSACPRSRNSSNCASDRRGREPRRAERCTGAEPAEAQRAPGGVRPRAGGGGDGDESARPRQSRDFLRRARRRRRWTGGPKRGALEGRGGRSGGEGDQGAQEGGAGRHRGLRPRAVPLRRTARISSRRSTSTSCFD